jgi:hypothetical protein
MAEAPPIHVAFLLGAFWVALGTFARREARDGWRFIACLLLAAALAHGAWCGLRFDLVVEHPDLLLQPAAGFSTLPVPLAAWTVPRRSRAQALSSILAGLAFAKLGCAVTGCCAFDAREATGPGLQCLEAAGLLAVHCVGRHPKLSAELQLAAMLTGFGVVRLVSALLRELPLASVEATAPALVCAAYLIAGIAWGLTRLVKPVRVRAA